MTLNRSVRSLLTCLVVVAVAVCSSGNAASTSVGVTAEVNEENQFEIFAQRYAVNLRGATEPTPEVLAAMSERFVKEFNEVSARLDGSSGASLRLISMEIDVGEVAETLLEGHKKPSDGVAGIATQVGTCYGDCSTGNYRYRISGDGSTIARRHARVVERLRMQSAHHPSLRRLQLTGDEDNVDLDIVSLESVPATDEDAAVVSSANAQVAVDNIRDLLWRTNNKVKETDSLLADARRTLFFARREMSQIPDTEVEAREAKQAEIDVLISDKEELETELSEFQSLVSQHSRELREANRQLRKANRLARGVRVGAVIDQSAIDRAIEIARERNRAKNRRDINHV